jgi:site-specific DNA-methyltransferase (adenine-specific)
VTSPPYDRLRDYQHAAQLGLEAHVDQWVERLQVVLHELRRVLIPSGSVWLNLGDSYSTGTEGGPAKSLLLGPERLALALSREGWIVRNKIIWAKRNPMPNSARDRFSCTWDVNYLLVRQRNNFFDLDAIRIPHTTTTAGAKTRAGAKTAGSAWSVPPSWRVSSANHSGLASLSASGRVGHPLGKNPGDVWPLSTASYRGAHHAVFPVALAERPILAGSPEQRCPQCRAPWRRTTVRELGRLAVRGELRPTCTCNTGSEPAVVLDPFMGSGTTAIAAERNGRNWLGIEVNPEFARLAEQRIEAERNEPQQGRRAA